ncbi:MAG: NADH-quinone oxidoreductase subunit A [SAR324 cluster bacterium]|nr:NADH-quinone oxidoreductase subunit A [SAR324 cluster bacterium]
MVNNYFGYLVLVVVSLGMASSFTLIAVLLGPKKRSAVKDLPFETGMPYVPSAKSVNVKFYLVAMLFLIFDIEVAFLYPYALKVKEYGWTGFIAVSAFLLVLGIGIVYEWRKKILEWDKD